MNNKTVCVVGLGYVGLPLAKAFSKHLKTIGLEDVSKFMNNKPVLVDARGMFSEEEAKKKGFYYRSV